MQPLIFLEMNEICIDFIKHYISKGHLKNFAKFIENHDYTETTSVTNYDDIEPWIQWVSARTGRTYAEHKVFRLGDIVNTDLTQHWELIEENGYSVAACSPINASNKTKSSPFWIPDPWVKTSTSGSNFLKSLSQAINQAVNNNASEQLTLGATCTLLKSLVLKSQRSSWGTYFKSLLGVANKQHWSKALILDRLLADTFIKEWKIHRPEFSTLFLNAAAHIQHHYMFNSSAYTGKQKNPGWYITPSKDPILEIYQIYDDVLGEATSTGARIMIASGISQIPYEQTTFYYRLKNHEKLLEELGIEYSEVHPRMSRDFLVVFKNNEQCKDAQTKLDELQAQNGTPIFTTDNRGESLFITLTYPLEISNNFNIYNKNNTLVVSNFDKDVAFVAIKNGQHTPIGIYMDSYSNKETERNAFPIEKVFELCLNHFDIEHVNAPTRKEIAA